MKISIITVVYNGERTIRDTIESVLAQTHPDVEYIIIDGNSKDSTLEIIKNYGERIHTVLSEPDKGIYDAMNKGIKIATGEVVGLLNADDVYASSDVLAEVARRIVENHADAVYGDLLYVAANDPEKVTRTWKAGAYAPGDFLWGWMPPHPTFFLKRNCYQKYGDFRLDMGSAADYELMLRMIHKNEVKLSYIQKTLVRMRVGGASNSTFKNRLIANRNDQKAWKVNGLKPYVITVLLKPIRKILQFFP
ncbi:glycosyltransferase family 2 protein [Salmonirosea aquatica]|uniref:Glycosyltransferase n=1 Tax=Salmonirosea aquatica TaxID=2654236 RepID=A0A7C9FZJ6_9BACT|nr:glycosyltransferase [Cytophagaceae bacterium SJW1-29]